MEEKNNVQPKAKSAVSTKENKDVKDAKYEDLESQIKDLKDMFAQFLKTNAEKTETKQMAAEQEEAEKEPVEVEMKKPEANYKYGDDVVIVHMIQNADGFETAIPLTSVTIVFKNIGDEFLLTSREADELVGKYRKYFEDGIIAVGVGYEEFARRKRLNMAISSPLYNFRMEELYKFNAVELERLFNAVAIEQKKSILGFYQRKIIEKDPKYMDASKIEMLNRVSNNAWKYIKDEAFKDTSVL